MEAKFRLCHGEHHFFCDDLGNLTIKEAEAALADLDDDDAGHLEVWDEEEGWVVV